MKRKFGKTGIFRVAAAMATVAIMSCCTFTSDDIVGPTPIPGGASEGEVVILLNMPANSTPATRSDALTRSIAGDEESEVKAVDVFVFDVAADAKETFAYHKIGQVVENSEAGGVYKVKFKTVLKIADNQNVAVVANARTLVDGLTTGGTPAITEGMDKTDLLALLEYARTTAWTADNSLETNWTPIPMYGETGKQNITVGKNFSMRLTRALARIDIQTTAGSNFTLQNVYLANYMTRGRISPVWNTPKGTVLQAVATAPNLGSGASWATSAGNFFTYPYAETESGTGLQKGEIYTFESAAADDAVGRKDATCLILEGLINSGGLASAQKQFYRVDFTYDGSGSTTQGDYMPLLRNHKYVITVGNADEIGYATKEEALASYTVQSNLHTRIIHYNESDLTSIVSNGQYMLGVQVEEIALAWDGKMQKNIVMTDYDYDYSGADDTIDEIGWRIVGFSDTENGAVSATHAWLRADKETDDATKGNMRVWAVYNLAAVTDVNAVVNLASGTPREAWVHLQAGRLTHKVKVSQGIGSGTFDPVHDSPNCYAMQPTGLSVTIPAVKPWIVWASPEIGEQIDPTLPLTAEMLWEDEQGLIENVTLMDGDQGFESRIYVKAKNGKMGNAVVALKSGSKTIWSWHIWVSNYGFATYDINNGTKIYQFMRRNLGSLSNEPYGSFDYTQTYGMMYMWGRKDPFPGFKAHPSTFADGTPMLSALKPVYPSGAIPAPVPTPEVRNLANAVANPTQFYAGKDWYTNDFNNSRNDQLWNRATVGGKTVYDPCPAGWKVPAPSTANGEWDATGIVKSPWYGNGWSWVGLANRPGTWTYAHHGYTISGHGYYPFAGRIRGDGVTELTTGLYAGYAECIIWTASIAGGTGGVYSDPVFFCIIEPCTDIAANLKVNITSRTSLRSVRCVKE